ncbi:hypothetical protein B0H67DRAFT_496310 [Lasiosphaeris hirsuta]|uniref:Meiotic recombination protein DMC1 n=1 Tax=Lasiosphaeris hirsuta TaxID=260670 RepID=A0AA40A251_9PEZI|nr:hypothetical protein B0H67DRAFT_496310 [Lasiosphaeris hirsuta]
MAETPGTPNAGAGAGGFVVPLPSPAPSSTSTPRSTSGLPHPRGHALRPGSVKEDKVRNYVSDRLMHISRRFIKKQSGLPGSGDDIVGYKSMGELSKDLEGLLNIIWLSGTPRLQVPYLLNIAGDFNTWITDLPASPTATFSALRKLDHCFASLLSGKDIETNEPLPGFENGLRAGMSKTDMVRCKSLVEQTRVLVVDVMGQQPDEEDGVEEVEHAWTPDTADEAESEPEGPDGRPKDFLDDDEERYHMDVARVYERTLVALGEALGAGGGVGEIQISAD